MGLCKLKLPNEPFRDGPSPTDMVDFFIPEPEEPAEPLEVFEGFLRLEDIELLDDVQIFQDEQLLEEALLHAAEPAEPEPAEPSDPAESESESGSPPHNIVYGSSIPSTSSDGDSTTFSSDTLERYQDILGEEFFELLRQRRHPTPTPTITAAMLGPEEFLINFLNHEERLDAQEPDALELNSKELQGLMRAEIHILDCTYALPLEPEPAKAPEPAEEDFLKFEECPEPAQQNNWAEELAIYELILLVIADEEAAAAAAG